MTKKLFTLVVCAVAVLSAFGQTNLAAGKPSIATTGTAGLGNDGDAGTRWESAAADPQSWQVDLLEATTFNTIRFIWEGAYAKTFTILAGNEVGDDGFLTDGVEIASVTGQALAGFPNYQVLNVSLNAPARYVQFKGIERGTPWGYSFWEFGVYNLEEAPTLATLTLTAAANQTTLGTNVPLTVAARNSLGVVMDDVEVEYELSNPAVGSIDNGEFIPAAAGTTTIKAKAGNIESNEVTITVNAGAKIDLFTDWQYRIYTLGRASNKDKVGAFDDNDGSVWGLLGKETGADEASRTYDAGFIADLRGVYNISSIAIHFEGACSEAFTLAFAGEDGVFGEAVYSGGATGINNHTETFSGEAVQARYVKFLSTKAATQWDVKIFDFAVYGTLVTEVTDDVNPTLSAAAADEAAATEETVTLKVTANDNSSKYLTYLVNNDYYAIGETPAGEEASIVIEGLNGGTEYTFNVVAIDAFGNRSEAQTVTASTVGDTFVLEPAPTPEHAAEDVISIYSDAYQPATTYFWGGWGQATAVAEEAVNGDNLYRMSNFNYLGFDGFNPNLDLSEMKYIHVDVLPMAATNFGITPILVNPNGGAGLENSQVKTLTVKEWNSIDIALEDFNLDFTNKAFQLKIDQGNGNVVIYVDNIYFWKEATPAQKTVAITDEEGTELTELTLAAGESKQLKAKVTPEDPTAAPVVTWATSDENVVTVTEDGLITAVKQNAMIRRAPGESDATATITATVDGVTAELLVTVNATTGIEVIGTTAPVASVKYINAMGQVSDTAFQGVNIVVTTYTDGTTGTVKVVK